MRETVYLVRCGAVVGWCDRGLEKDGGLHRMRHWKLLVTSNGPHYIYEYGQEVQNVRDEVYLRLRDKEARYHDAKFLLLLTCRRKRNVRIYVGRISWKKVVWVAGPILIIRKRKAIIMSVVRTKQGKWLRYDLAFMIMATSSNIEDLLYEIEIPKWKYFQLIVER